MPANENTWRNMPSMHMVFGLTSLAMLLATIWMLTSDHNREWKTYHNEFRRMEQISFAWRADEQQTQKYEQELASLRAELAAAQTATPSETVVDNFLDVLIAETLFQQTATVSATPAEPDESAQASQTHIGRLTKDQLPSELTNLFADLDADKSGLLDPAEVYEQLRSTRTLPDPKARETAREKYKPLRDWAVSQDKNLATLLVEYTNLSSAQGDEARRNQRQALLNNFNQYVIVARDRYKAAARTLKFRRGERDAKNSMYQLAITKQQTPAEIAALKSEVEAVEKEIEILVLKEQTTNATRSRLEKLINTLKADETEAASKLKTKEDELASLEKARDLRSPNEILEAPVFDAFNSPVRIEQLWCPDLKINYNLAWVARYDRCTTCHQAITKTAPGSATEPGDPHLASEPLKITLTSPAAAPLPQEDDGKFPISPRDLLLRRAYGMDLADKGVWENDVAIRAVWSAETASLNDLPDSAARAGLLAGDVIKRINGDLITSREMAQSYLLDTVVWGQPLELEIDRGQPHPYATHPRLDLYLGSASPHPKEDFGCTDCHHGQGSATTFRWSSHTPNTPNQEAEWDRKGLGWFSNHDWPFLMYPQRFVESGCLKCHHEVTELEPSERFVEAPAPKVMAGYHLIRQNGCFGCHEINGFDGPDTRIGPDLRTEPMYYAAAQQLLHDPWFTTSADNLSDAEKTERPNIQEMAESLVRDPQQNDLRKRLGAWLIADANRTLPLEEGETGPAKKASWLTSTSHSMAPILGADDEAPGQLRKAGPSLRYVSSKVEDTFLYDWVKRPQHFRPSTKMPQFFGLQNHLPGPDPIHVTEKQWEAFYAALQAAVPPPPAKKEAADADEAKPEEAKPETAAGRIYSRLPGSVKQLVAQFKYADLDKEAREHIEAGLS